MGCVSFRVSKGSGKGGATPVSPASGVSRLWLENRQATGRDQKKKKESYERCAWKDKAGSGRDRRCPGQEANELLNSASQKQGQWLTLCPTWGSWGRCRTRQPPLPPSQVPSIASPEVSKPLTQKHFSAIPQKTKPRALHLVFCARLCLLCPSHGAQGRAQKAAPAGWSAASVGMTWLTYTT